MSFIYDVDQYQRSWIVISKYARKRCESVQRFNSSGVETGLFGEIIQPHTLFIHADIKFNPSY